MNPTYHATKIHNELSRSIDRFAGYLPSDNKIIQSWDRVFFGMPVPYIAKNRPCVCGGTLHFRMPLDYITGQWDCDKCTRLIGATIAETIGGLMAMVQEKGK